MEKARLWGFPVALIAAWMLAAAYTLSFLIGPSQTQSQPEAAPEEVIVAS